MVNQSTQSTVRWGVLGAGGIARKFIHSARATESDNPVVAVASETEGKAAKLAAEMAIETSYNSYEALLAAPDVDAVYVANTHNFHRDTVLLALGAGKHVLCEKPMAINAREVSEMIEKARSAGLFLMEAMWTRFLPACRQLVDWIAEGRIGEVRQIEASFGFIGDFKEDGRMLNPNLAGGALLDMGIYPLSFASRVMGGETPEAVVSLMTLGSTGVDEDDVVLLQYAGDIKAILRCSMRTKVINLATVVGTKGRITLPPGFIGQTEVQLETESETLVRRFPIPPQTGFRYEIDHAAECIRTGQTESPIMPLGETLMLAETLDKVRAAGGLRYPGE